VEGRECLGEECCSLHGEARQHFRHPNCAKEQWFGLYCAKYQRFYCAGMDNCSSTTSYMQHLNNFKQGQWRS
jgi:hypothetical protein